MRRTYRSLRGACVSLCAALFAFALPATTASAGSLTARGEVATRLADVRQQLQELDARATESGGDHAPMALGGWRNCWNNWNNWCNWSNWQNWRNWCNY